MKYQFISFVIGFICAMLIEPRCFIFLNAIAKFQITAFKRNIKTFERQCRIFYILRARYHDKAAIKLFDKGNKTNNNGRQ
jgi:hypothetical protein